MDGKWEEEARVRKLAENARFKIVDLAKARRDSPKVFYQYS